VRGHADNAIIQDRVLGGRLTSLAGKLNAVAVLTTLGWPSFLALGAVALWCGARLGRKPGVQFVLGWWLVTVVCVAVWIPFAWPRYVVPLVPPCVLLVGVAAAAALQSLVAFSRSRLTGPK
jgi:hypothetical protein